VWHECYIRWFRAGLVGAEQSGLRNRLRADYVAATAEERAPGPARAQDLRITTMLTSFSALGLVMQQAPATLPVKESPEVLQDVTKCRDIADPSERLACFDAATKTLEEKTANNEVVVVEREEIAKEKRRRFGLSLPDFGIFGGGVDRGEDDVREISTTIAAISEFGYEKYRFALTDGSIWATTESNRNLRPRKGDTIVIERGALGGYTAKIDDDDLVRVARVQ
jgi:hypothetical protein